MTKHHPAKEVELYRDGDEYVVLFDLPDREASEVSVRWRDGRLHVSAGDGVDGERGALYHRSVGVPTAVADERITAAFDDGVLEVTLPVSDDEDDGREIPVGE